MSGAIGEQPGMHVLAKPIGPVCDIDCEYCFYLEKRALFDADERYRMPDAVLAAYIAQYVADQPTPVVEFTWHGGEPTLLGLDFFRRVVELQAPHRAQKEIRNSLQTNGLHLDDDWCRFSATRVSWLASVWTARRKSMTAIARTAGGGGRSNA